MTGISSIDVSLINVWRSWYAFVRGKRKNRALDLFCFNLEKYLPELQQELVSGTYRHGDYQTFIVTDNKRRIISVAPLRDRVVHRLVYEYLVKLYDHTFIFDAWSCRKDKGLLGAIERTQEFLRRYPRSFIWRTDVKKFFDSVSQEVLLQILQRKIKDQKTLGLLKEIIFSYPRAAGARERERERERETKSPKMGMPIGNLTSQIFANIYFNEFDRFVSHTLKPQAYLRYGDDFIICAETQEQIVNFRAQAVKFLEEALKLHINPKHDRIVKAAWGLHFLGCRILPKGRRLNNRNRKRIQSRLSLTNLPSYSGLIRAHDSKKVKEFSWRTLNIQNLKT